ncbi:MAG: hypothetical protein M1826_005581 [Phylliscum demangeonii]|nr:MAG: hypothetical protein M1826_005581 [Phylliscum demangeonii]
MPGARRSFGPFRWSASPTVNKPGDSVSSSDSPTMRPMGRNSSEHALSNHHRRSPSSPAPPTSLHMIIESPPLVCYGPARTSTGALLSGRLVLTVLEPEVRMARLALCLEARVTIKKPAHHHCADCACQTTALFQMELLTEAHVFKKGAHEFPFSHLLPGHLSASANGPLAAVEYRLAAEAVSSSSSSSSSFSLAGSAPGRAFGPADKRIVVRHEWPLDVKRAILPGRDRTSTRIFPPTPINALVVVPPVVHPLGEFRVHFRLSGVVRRGHEMQTRWRLRKLNWRIEEHSRLVAAACAKHRQPRGLRAGLRKPVGHAHHQDARIVGAADLKRGWKTDFSPRSNEHGDGLIEIDFAATVSDARALCDLDLDAPAAAAADPDTHPVRLSVWHTLVVELVVVEEYCPTRDPQLSTPTGTARILRMTFPLLVTARSGLGIAWDEELPPTYGDVPPSPPHYRLADVESYTGEVLDEDDDDDEAR